MWLLVIWVLVVLAGLVVGGLWICESVFNPSIESRKGFALGCFVVVFSTLVNVGGFLFLLALPRQPFVFVGGGVCVVVCLVRMFAGSGTFAVLFFSSLITLFIGFITS